MRASVGDRIVSDQPDGLGRRAEVLQVRDLAGRPPYVIRWEDTGHEALYFPLADDVVESAERRTSDLAGARRTPPPEIWWPGRGAVALPVSA